MATSFNPLKMLIVYLNSPTRLIFYYPSTNAKNFSIFYTEQKYVQFWLIFA